jgi:hypothetical protein
MNDQGRAFGEEQLRWVLYDNRVAPLAEGLQRLVGAVEAWCAPAKAHDDISVLAVELA